MPHCHFATHLLWQSDPGRFANPDWHRTSGRCLPKFRWDSAQRVWQSDPLLCREATVTSGSATMGRLITPVPRESLTSGARPKTDTSAERILKYIPAEVIAFYIAALGIIDSLPKETKG